MAKNNKKKQKNSNSNHQGKKPVKVLLNPLLDAQSKFLSKLPTTVRQNFFSDEHVAPDTRAEIWGEQADIGEDLVNKFSWATPDPKAIRILKYFGQKAGGIVEVGCGANAYWSRQMSKSGIDVLAFDIKLDQGGKIDVISSVEGKKAKKPKKKRKRDGDGDDNSNNQKRFEDGFVIQQGGPDVLSSKSRKDLKKRVLFLCYPDEEEMVNETTGSQALGSACLEHFQGDTVIHVGELFGDTFSLEQAPFGRSSGPEFQTRLFAEYHCILKASLTNWLHVNDTISVWKKSKCCSLVFEGEDEQDNDEEVEYKHIPDNEKLPSDIAAPCAKHLL